MALLLIVSRNGHTATGSLDSCLAGLPDEAASCNVVLATTASGLGGVGPTTATTVVHMAAIALSGGAVAGKLGWLTGVTAAHLVAGDCWGGADNWHDAEHNGGHDGGRDAGHWRCGGVGNICSLITSIICHKLATSPSALSNLSIAWSTFHSVSICFCHSRIISSLRSSMFDVFRLSAGVVGGFVLLPAAVVTGLVVHDVFPSHTGLSISTHSNTK